MDGEKDDVTRARLYWDLYGHDLYLALFGRCWSQAVAREAEQETDRIEAEYLRGYAQAIADVAAHLEVGEALPGGPLYRHVASRLVREGHRC